MFDNFEDNWLKEKRLLFVGGSATSDPAGRQHTEMADEEGVTVTYLDDADPAAEMLTTSPEDIDPDAERKKLMEDVEKNKIDIEYTKTSTKAFEAQDKKIRESLDRVQLSKNRKDNEVSPVADFSSATSILKMRDNFAKLGQNIESPFYKQCFGILLDSINSKKNPLSENEKYAHMFNEPVKYLDDIAKIKSKKFNTGNYAIAIRHCLYIEGAVVAINESQRKLTEKSDTEEVWDQVTGAGGGIVDEFKDAWRKKDWTKIALFATGGFFLLKGGKFLFDKVTGGNAGTGGALTLLIGAGVIGYAARDHLEDLIEMGGEMSGYYDPNYDAAVDGTSLSAMHDVLEHSGEEDAMEKSKTLDYELLAQMSEAEVKSLWDERNTSLEFINPQKFSNLFPDYKKLPAFDETKGQAELDKYGDTNKKRDLLKDGHGLYQLVMATKEVYEKSLMKYHPDYERLAFEDMLKKKEKKGLTMLELFDGIKFSWDVEFGRRMESVKACEKSLGEVFKGHDVDLKVVTFYKENIYGGWLMGHPVEFEFDTEKNKYIVRGLTAGNMFLPIRAYKDLGEVSVESSASSDISAVIKGIKDLSYSKFKEKYVDSWTAENISISDNTPSNYEYKKGAWWITYEKDGVTKVGKFTFDESGKIKEFNGDSSQEAIAGGVLSVEYRMLVDNETARLMDIVTKDLGYEPSALGFLIKKNMDGFKEKNNSAPEWLKLGTEIADLADSPIEDKTKYVREYLLHVLGRHYKDVSRELVDKMPSDTTKDSEISDEFTLIESDSSRALSLPDLPGDDVPEDKKSPEYYDYCIKKYSDHARSNRIELLHVETDMITGLVAKEFLGADGDFDEQASADLKELIEDYKQHIDRYEKLAASAMYKKSILDGGKSGDWLDLHLDTKKTEAKETPEHAFWSSESAWDAFGNFGLVGGAARFVFEEDASFWDIATSSVNAGGFRALAKGAYEYVPGAASTAGSYLWDRGGDVWNNTF